MFNPFKKKPFGIDDFAMLVIAEAKKAGIAESLEYDSKSSVLKRGDQRTYLVNLFNDYCQANDTHKKRILGIPWLYSGRKRRTFHSKRPNPRWWRRFESRLSFVPRHPNVSCSFLRLEISNR